MGVLTLQGVTLCMDEPTESYYAVQVVSCTHHGWTPGAWVRRVHDPETGRDSNEVCRFPELSHELEAKGYLRDLNDHYGRTGTKFGLVKFVRAW